MAFQCRLLRLSFAHGVGRYLKYVAMRLQDARRALNAQRMARAIGAWRDRMRDARPDRTGSLGADRELRARPRDDYREARTYTRREGEGATTRVVRRGPVGAEVGPVMLRKIDGRLPMVGDARWPSEGVG